MLCGSALIQTVGTYCIFVNAQVADNQRGSRIEYSFECGMGIHADTR